MNWALTEANDSTVFKIMSLMIVCTASSCDDGGGPPTKKGGRNQRAVSHPKLPGPRQLAGTLLSGIRQPRELSLTPLQRHRGAATFILDFLGDFLLFFATCA